MKLLLAALLGIPLADGRVRTAEAPVLAPGERAEVSITIVEAASRDMPLQVRLAAEGLTILDNRLGWNDVVDPGAELPRVRARIVAPKEPGEYDVRGLVVYVTCSEKTCRPRYAEVNWSITVR